MGRCQFCHTPLEPVHGSKVFERCPQDYLIWNTQYSKTKYENEYFQTEYRLQYGREYLADKPSIVKRMNERWNIFEKLVPKSYPEKPRLLEFGSAAGFFLEIAMQSGWDPEGWEVSRLMSEYANHHGLKTRCGSITDLSKKNARSNQNKFDCVAAFYLLEHLENQPHFWSTVKQMLKPGGHLLLALPSSFGPLFYFDFESWQISHPKDHIVDYSPASLTKIAAYYGFRVLHSSIESTHPDRFKINNYAGVVFPALSEIQKRLVFSDTFFSILTYKPVNEIK